MENRSFFEINRLNYPGSLMLKLFWFFFRSAFTNLRKWFDQNDIRCHTLGWWIFNLYRNILVFPSILFLAWKRRYTSSVSLPVPFLKIKLNELRCLFRLKRWSSASMKLCFNKFLTRSYAMDVIECYSADKIYFCVAFYNLMFT